MNEVKIIRKNVKNLTLKINRYGEITLSVPLKLPECIVRDFLLKKAAWINKKQELIATFTKSFCKFGDGEVVEFLGNKYILRFILSDFEKVEIEQNQFIIYFIDSDVYKIEKFLDHWYHEKAKEIFLSIVDRYSKILNKNVKIVRIRKMKTRWGSCNHIKNYINLNVDMIKKPLHFIEFVILHELAHLTHPNHSNKFYDYLSFYMPDWRERAKII